MQIDGFINCWEEATKFWFSHIGKGISFTREVREPYDCDKWTVTIFGFTWFGSFTKVPNE